MKFTIVNYFTFFLEALGGMFAPSDGGMFAASRMLPEVPAMSSAAHFFVGFL